MKRSFFNRLQSQTLTAITAAAVALLVSTPNQLSAQGQVVGPGGYVVKGTGPNWIPWTMAGGTAEVTRDKPRSGWGDVGEGSLRLSVTGQQSGDYPDWAFWYRYAGGTAENSLANWNTSGSFGSLADISSLSFDWFRQSADGWDTPCNPSPDVVSIPPCDWVAKTPVLRLQLAEYINGQVVQTELIWEGYFNQQAQNAGGIGGTHTPVNEWVSTTNMQEGNFWYHRPAGEGDPLYSTTGGACDMNTFNFWQGDASASAIQQLLGAGGCIDSNAQVIGIAVGVGSQWPLQYTGFVDNVMLGFDGQTVLDANFDYVVPEPSTWALMSVGLSVLAIAARRKRRSQAGNISQNAEGKLRR